ncbi:MAG TPA: hypothetical protein VH601_13085 [Bryobacteraceae bacterium]
MKTAFAISAILLCASTCGAASLSCGSIGPNGVPVTPNLVVFCAGNRFDFGHDPQNRTFNPLPLGGSVTLKSMFFFVPDDEPEWDIDFGFPSPAARTTELDFYIFGRGPIFLALGRHPSPFGSPPNLPNESGSDFMITETVKSVQYPSQATLFFDGVDGDTVYRGGPGGDVKVTTVITDKAGDLTGFDEGFATPEPGSWTLFAVGLLLIPCMAVGRRSTHSIRRRP